MNERIALILKNSWTIPTAVGIVSFGGGVGLGYILGRRKVIHVHIEDYEEVEFEDDEDPEFKEYFNTEGAAADREGVKVIIDAEDYGETRMAPPTDADISADGNSVTVRSNPVDRFIESVQDEAAIDSEEDTDEELPQPADVDIPDDEDEEPEPIRMNVFEDPNWDWEVEVEGRGAETEPFVLHRDEFYRNEFEYTQSTLTYYEGDDTMVEEGNEEPILNYRQLTGELKFGHGSGDPNVVLVRNNQRRGEYEIVRHPGKYAVEVMGYEAEQRGAQADLRHSRNHRFADGD